MRLAPWGGAQRFPVTPPPTVVALKMNVYKLKQRVIVIIAINSSARLQQQQVWGRGKGQKAGPPIY